MVLLIYKLLLLLFLIGRFLVTPILISNLLNSLFLITALIKLVEISFQPTSWFFLTILFHLFLEFS